MILIDASSPAIAVQSTGSVATVVTASFTPPDGSVLAIRYSANTIDPNDPGNPLITDSLGTHLNYIPGDIGKRPDAPTAEGQVATWVAFVPPGTPSMTITVTNGAASPNRHAAVLVKVLTGVDIVAMSGQHGKSSSTTNITSIAAAYTASRTGSLGLLVVADWFDAGAESAGGTGNTLEGSADVAANYVYAFLRRTNPDGVAGVTTTITSTVPTSSNIRWAWLEMLPDGDGAAPAATLGLPPGMPAPMGLAAMVARFGPDGATTPIMPETGTGVLLVIGTGTAVKKVAQTGSCTIPVRTSGAGVKRAPQSAAGAVTVAVRGQAVKVAPQAGTGALAVAAAGTETTASARAQTGAGTVAIRASGTAAKRTAQAGTAQVGIRQAGAEIHTQAQTGAAAVPVRTSGAASKIAKETGVAGLVVAASGAGAKRTAQAGTATLGVVGTGAEQSGVTRAQTGAGVLAVRAAGAATKRAVVTGAAMLATVGTSTPGKRTPQAGAAAAAVRTNALITKKAAAAGRGVVTISPLGIGGKRIAATGRTVVPILGFGNATLELPAVRLGDRLEDILNSLVSFVLRLGIFQRVQQHEPKSAPRNGLTAALWLQTMAPAIGESSLSSTSLRVAWFLRIYQNFLSEPQDLIDPSVMRAMAAVMEALTANFDLDLPAVRAIDLLGMTGPPMGAEAGYVPMGPPNAQKIYRCMTLTIPIIVDDAFVQVA